MLKDILMNSKAPMSNGVQVVQVEKYKEEKVDVVDMNQNLSVMLKEHKIKDVCHALCTLSSSLDEENILEFLFKLPNNLNKAVMKGMDKVEMYNEFIDEMQNYIEIDTLSDKLKVLLFFHTLILGTSMDKIRFMTSLFKRIDTFDILSLLEVIALHFKLYLSGDYEKSHKKSIIPSFDSILKWTSLILDTGLIKMIGHKEEYESILIQLKELTEECIKKKEDENLLKVRLAAGINRVLSLPSVSQSDIILETIYL